MVNGMKSWRVRLCAAALMAGAAAMPLAAMAQDKPKRQRGKKAKAPPPAAPTGAQPSPSYRPAALALQTALGTKDVAASTAALATAEAAVTTDGDRYLQSSFELQLALLTKDAAMQAASLDKMIASPLMPERDTGQFNFFSGQFAYGAQDYAKTIARLTAAKAAGYANPNLDLMLVNSKFLMLVNSKLQTGDLDGGLADAKAAIATMRAAGITPPESLFVGPAQGLQRAGRTDELLEMLGMRLQDYPNVAMWRNTLLVHLRLAGGDKPLGLDILRLMQVVGAMEQRGEFQEYAALATEAGLPGEVVKLIDSAWKSGKVSTDDKGFKEIMDARKGKAAEDQRNIESDYRRALASTNAVVVRATADVLFGFGEYSRSAELFRSAAAMGGLDADMVNLRLGMALAMAEQYDAAQAALGNVGGNRARLAGLWQTYIATHKVAALPESPAAPTEPAATQ